MSAPIDTRTDDEPTTSPTLASAQEHADRAGIEHPVQRLRAEGSGRLLGVVWAVTAAVAMLIWQPWGRGSARTAPSQAFQAPAVAVDQALPSHPSPSPAVEGSAPADAPGALVVADTQPYVSLVDNEWTVVALLSADGPVSTEEPSIQHGRGSWSTGDQVLVLQQGLDDQARPIDTRKAPDSAW